MAFWRPPDFFSLLREINTAYSCIIKIPFLVLMAEPGLPDYVDEFVGILLLKFLPAMLLVVSFSCIAPTQIILY